MHMSDALISAAVGGAMYVASAAAIGASAYKLRREEEAERKLPVMAVSGAFVFAAQMINFTIPGTGSSGHIGGGILLASLLGEGPALLTIAAVLLIQCLFFADGGLLALGCNIFNMGVLPCLLVYPLVVRPLLAKGINKKNLTLASVLGVVIGLQLGAFGVVLETTASGISELPFGAFVALMQPIHLAIGLVEGLITAAILSYVHQVRPELLEATQQRKPMAAGVSVKKLAVTLAIAALVVGGGVSLLASGLPDGLEWAMEKVAGTSELEGEGSAHDAAQNIQDSTAFMPDYDFAQGSEGGLSGTTVAGVVGSILTCALAGGAGLLIAKTKKK